MDPSVTRPLTVGIDLAKTTDYTAIAVTERLPGKTESQPEFETRILKRLPHDTKYRTVAKYLAQLVKNLQVEALTRTLAALMQQPDTVEERAIVRQALRLPEAERIRLLAAFVQQQGFLEEIQIIADATGVGNAVVELIEEETEALPCRVIAATFRFGDMLDWNAPGGLVVGKARLVRTLKILLQEGRLHLPSDDPDAPLAADEIRNYQIRVSEAGNEQYGAFSVGKHDDIATAIGLSVLERYHSRIIPAAASRTWLPGWERGIMSSQEEDTWSEQQKEARRKHVAGVARFLHTIDPQGFHQ